MRWKQYDAGKVLSPVPGPQFIAAVAGTRVNRPSPTHLPRAQMPRKCQLPAVIPSVLLSLDQKLGGCSFSAPAAPPPSPPPRLLMSLVFSSNHSSYNTGLGEAKNSSPSHMTAPNAEAPSKGTSATPCFLGNESHSANAARVLAEAHCFL